MLETIKHELIERCPFLLPNLNTLYIIWISKFLNSKKNTKLQYQNK